MVMDFVLKVLPNETERQNDSDDDCLWFTAIHPSTKAQTQITMVNIISCCTPLTHLLGSLNLPFGLDLN